MRVLIIRHGQAVDSRAAATDHVRWLTDKGRTRTARVGAAIAEAGLTYRCIYTSPLVRAVQTAEILATVHPEFTGPLEVHEPLAIDHGTTAQALTPIEHAADDDLIALVSHMPKVQALAAHLCGMPNFPGFKTSAACLVNVDADGRGAFQWMMDPKSLELRSARGTFRS